MSKKTSKVKQMEKLFPFIDGKKVRINPKGNHWIATVDGWTGAYLKIKDVTRARDGKAIETQMIHALWIDEIQIFSESKINPHEFTKK